MKSMISFIFLSLLLLHFYNPIRAQNTDPFVICGTNGNYTSGSSFQQNLNQTLTSLAANASPTGYYTASAGQNPNAVYGLIQCRAYLSKEDCQTCADKVVSEVTQLCPYRKEATRYNGECSLQYSDWRFFGQLDSTLRIIVTYGGEKPSNMTLFRSQLRYLLQNLTLIAQTDNSRLAMGSISYLTFTPIYGMVECVRDLSGQGCVFCLQDLFEFIPSALGDQSNGQLSAISCSFRYGLFKFFQFSLPPPPPPPPSPPLPLQPPPSPLPRPPTSPLEPNATFASSNDREGGNDEYDGSSSETLLVPFSVLKAATSGFSDGNKLGQGGFGAVYKGKMPDGQEVAVKRLLTSSSQGLEELKTEVRLVAKLEHTNLVRLLGCCIQGKEQLLVYEYISNGSLDQLLFAENRKSILTWETRYRIIVGIARGMLYLHEDSRLKIVHRDLKGANILLDESMNPKIADFGTARLFSATQTHISTKKVAGTRGYMPPEYVKNGQFSTVSDVYSFGILLLEIISGERITTPRNYSNLQSDAWEYWVDGKALNLLDRTLGRKYPRHEVLKCIHIAAYFTCQNDRNYTSGSPYHLNLNLTFKSLASNASADDYSTASIGSGPDQVYGLIQCTGYTPRDACQACATNMVSQITQMCPNQKQGSIYNEKCTLQYSDMNFFSDLDSTPRFIMWNNVNASDLVLLKTSLGALLKSLWPHAAESLSRIASGNSTFTKVKNIYALVQCSKGISGSDCLTCLQNVSMTCLLFLDKGESGFLFAPSCNLRYDTHLFYSALPAFQPGLDQPPPPSLLEEENQSISHVEASKISVILAMAAALALLIMAVGDSNRSLESLLTEFDKLREATNNFADENKLGQGGFGVVYKGKMVGGQEIAVKRLSTGSKQGLEELQTEVMLVAKLLHQNLVKLLGFCIDEEEKLLVYEYLPNGSLDKFLFDKNRRLKLNWEMRYNIIVGIARGLLYLHEECPLKIIHRDMKASNILLDESMTPKISDFGLARLFPGTKNSSFQDSRNLQSYAWRHWVNGTALKIVDSTLGDEFEKDEALKCINIGLLCVQEAAANRPTMSDILLKLGSYTKRGSPYNRNLNLTLAALAANASRTGYFTATTGQSPDIAYGLVQCRGYISPEECQYCAKALAANITQMCPNQKEAAILNEDCTLQYADWEFFSVPDIIPRLGLVSDENATVPVAFKSHLGELMKNLSSTAAADPSRLAFGRDRYGDFQWEDICFELQCPV
ncbi:unnamed protein product [Linum tenue]|uniref:non-specific serine/threonine protein kinase n=1 Tax=Linum tenue TaxID=586396 RepID=A0AAV0NQ51_9ROSI|nr:unnamed protein product [Linum tenue]